MFYRVAVAITAYMLAESVLHIIDEQRYKAHQRKEQKQ